MRSFPNSLGIGQYWAEVVIDECGTSDLLTFNVVEKGGIADKGTFIGLVNKLWNYVDEPVEIRAKFVNEGTRTVQARFLGDIRLDDKIIKVIETDEIDILAGNTEDLISYFTPVEPGRYVIRGRVIYNRKLSYEKSSILNVNYAQVPDTKTNIVRFIPLIVYIILLITIIFLIRLIMKTKKRRF
ncbi:MAG: hypothetical protein ABIC04_04885 [Nanoarchaeota archaeon]